MRVLEVVLDGLSTRTTLPRTVQELEDLARKKGRRCSCDSCTPRSKKLNCIRWPHFTISPLHERLATNRFGNTVFAPPSLSSRTTWPTEGMHLVRTIIAYFDQPLSRLNNEQLTARASLCRWRDRCWPALITTLSKPDGRTLIPCSEMDQLLQSINTLFFGGPIPGLTFCWRRISHNVLGRTTCSPSGPLITMNPHRTSRDFGDYAMLDFLSTLIHESVHAFLQCYPCWWCRSWDRDYTSGGHGRSFQMLAKKIEEVFPRLVGLPVKLGRFEAFLRDMGVREGKKKGWVNGVVPSVHDLEEWGFEDVERHVRNRDVKALIDRTYVDRSV